MTILRSHRLSLGLLALYIALVLGIAWSGRGDGDGRAVEEAIAAEAPPALPIAPPPGKVVVVVIDSLRRDLVSEARMPALHALSTRYSHVLVETCLANFTLPCVRELFEGTESPFAASIHNLSGTTGGLVNAVSLAAAAGLRTHVVGDDVLPTLYGGQAMSSHDTREMGEGYLERDVAAIRTAISLLDSADFLILHVYGTDKVAHFDRPGTAAYNDYFLAIDEAFTSLWGALDPARDHLFITGDHGHDDDGHHVRESALVVYGERFEPFVRAHRDVPVQQRDLFQWILAALGLVPPKNFGGQWLLPEPPFPTPNAEFWQRYTDRVATTMGVAPEAGRPAILAAIAAERQWQQGASQRALEGRWPLLALFGLAVAGLLTLEWASGRLRLGAALLLVVGLSGGLGFWAHAWAKWMHSNTGAVGLRNLAFYLSMPALGAILAHLSGQRGHARAASLWLGVLGVCIALPSGVYSYQVGQNWTWPLLLGFVALRVVQRRAQPADAWVAAFAGVLLVQEAGGWVYNFYPRAWLERSEVGSWLVALGLATLAGWLARPQRTETSGARKGLEPHWWLSVAAVGWVAYGAWWADIGPARSASGLLPVLLFMALLRALHAGPTASDERGGRAELGWASAAALACMLQSFWLLTDGFFLQNIDFGFTAPIVGVLGDFKSIPIVWVVCTAKYLTPPLLMIWGYALYTGRSGRELALLAAGWALLKVAALQWQYHLGALREGATLHELAAQELAVVWALGFSVLLAGLAVKGKRPLLSEAAAQRAGARG